MTLQETHRQRVLPRAAVTVSSAQRQMGGEPVGWGEVALLAAPQLLLGVVVLSGAFIVKMTGG